MKFKVYKVRPDTYYCGTSLVAAESAEKANEYLATYKATDRLNELDSRGYCDVCECDVIGGLFSTKDGFINHGIWRIG